MHSQTLSWSATSDPGSIPLLFNKLCHQSYQTTALLLQYAPCFLFLLKCLRRSSVLYAVEIPVIYEDGLFYGQDSTCSEMATHWRMQVYYDYWIIIEGPREHSRVWSARLTGNKKTALPCFSSQTLLFLNYLLVYLSMYHVWCVWFILQFIFNAFFNW